jgi:DNA mismatch repair protein MutL
MRSPIKLLGKEVVEKVAAGEVIERPSSVVKELIENSLDAGSSRITVEIRRGGIELIKVSDNGSGIPRDELVLAFTRHATSKIKSAEDLFCLRTLGFRGEALPSIAAIAEVQASSRRHEDLEGSKIILQSPDRIDIVPIGMPVGTSIIVKNLFYNTPARKKFLKSPYKETNIITDLIERYVFASPDVSFNYIADGRELLITPEKKTLRASVGYVYNADLAQQLLEVNLQEGPCRITGLISPPWVSKTNKSYYTLIINNRIIKNRMINQAVEKAWGGPGNAKKWPIFILHLSVPSDFIDVNIHPQKTEVKFADESTVFEIVFKAIRSALETSKAIKKIDSFQIASNYLGKVAAKDHTMCSMMKEEKSLIYDENLRENKDLSARSLIQGTAFVNFITTPDNYLSQTNLTKPILGNTIKILQPIGQLQGTYLVAEGAEGLYIIDPHAAHERILFEKYISESQLGILNFETLVFPETIKMNTLETQMLIENLPKLFELGFTIEYFGDTTFVVRTVPAGLDYQIGEICDFLIQLIMNKSQIRPEDFFIKGIQMLACQQAVKLNKAFTTSMEWNYFLEELSKCKEPYHCPHGRPTIILLSYKELASKFLR